MQPDRSFSTLTTTTFTSNVSGDQFGAHPGFQGIVTLSGVVEPSPLNNSSGCLYSSSQRRAPSRRSAAAR
uniref:Uncharacterized protein n=1 Tax=mine drainage metagenome TaxID=410659 RepID=E6PP11_9ZZZZ